VNSTTNQANIHLRGGRRYVAALSSFLVLIVLGITGFLNITSFEKSYVDSLVSSYSVAGGETRRSIEYSVKYHKPLDNFAGMAEILAEIKDVLPTVINVYVLLPNGRAIYDISGPIDTEVLTEKLASKIDFSLKRTEPTKTWLLIGDQYHAFVPLRSADGNWTGTVDIVFSGNVIAEKVNAYLYDTIKLMLAIAFIAILAIVSIVYKIKLFDSDYQLRKRGLMISMIVILGAAQASFGVINVLTFRTEYLQIVSQNLKITQDIISKRIDRVVQLGFSYKDLDGVDIWLRNLVGPVKEIDRVEIRENSGKLLYSSVVEAPNTASTVPLLENNQASSNKNSDSSADKELQISRTLTPDEVGETANLIIKVSESYVRQKLFDLGIDAFTMFATSIFFLVETLVLVIILLTNYTNKSVLSASQEGEVKQRKFAKTQNENSVRVLGFLLLLCSYMSISFIPLLMKEIYQPLWGLSPTFIIALPIASEMFGAFLSSLLVGHTIDKRGWHPVFVAGAIVLGLSTLASAYATEPVSFIFIRFLVGIGYGAAWMGLRGLVAAGHSPHERSKGFSILNAGIYAGQNCGAVLGALIAQRIGFSSVLILASTLILIALPFTFIHTLNSKPALTGYQHERKGAVRRFLLDKDTFIFFLMITIPAAITSAFLNYFFPIFANSAGVTQGDIGRGFLLYGICIVFAGPFIARRLRGVVQEKTLIVASCLFGVLALSIFCVIPTFTGALLAILVLGLSDAVGLVAQNNYFLSLPSSEKLGHGKSLSFYSAMKKIGQLAGPAAFGLAISFGTVAGIGAIAGGYFTSTLGFGIFSRVGLPKFGKKNPSDIVDS